MKEIQLTQGKVALIDDEDFERVNQFKWFAHRDREQWYAHRHEKGSIKIITMHGFILGIEIGEQIDHRDRSGLHNWRDNLRKCTPSQNGANRASKPNTTSKYLGVHWDRFRDKWRATIRKDRHTMQLGRFDNETDAAKAYNKAALFHHGEFANLNKFE